MKSDVAVRRPPRPCCLGVPSFPGCDDVSAFGGIFAVPFAIPGDGRGTLPPSGSGGAVVGPVELRVPIRGRGFRQKGAASASEKAIRRRPYSRQEHQRLTRRTGRDDLVPAHHQAVRRTSPPRSDGADAFTGPALHLQTVVRPDHSLRTLQSRSPVLLEVLQQGRPPRGQPPACEYRGVTKAEPGAPEALPDAPAGGGAPATDASC